MIHILIVEDDEDSRMILKKTLGSKGYTVEAAINGKEALQMARESQPDVIISDILMPVMDGFQLCIKCKADDGLKDIPFVFYTATYTDEKDEEAALKMGADRFIRKPAEPDELIKIIQGVIRDREKGGIKSGKPVVTGEKDVLKLYSERLVNKLEKKMLDLEKEIAEHKQAEEELGIALQKRKELELIVNKSPVMVFLWRATEGWPVEFVSDNIKQLGYTPEDFIDGHIRWYTDIIHNDDLKQVVDEVTMYSEQRAAEFTQEYRVINKSGDIRWTEDIMWIRYDQNGNITHYQGVVNDVTERKQAEEALRESETRYRAIFEGVAEGIMIADFETKEIRYANPAICRMLGYTEEEIKNLGVRGIHSKEDYDRVISKFEAQSREKITLASDIPFLRKDGTIIDTDINTARVFIDGRECNVGCVTDITKRKEAEDLIRRSLKEKETLLAEIHHRVKNNMQIISSLLSLQSEDIKDKKALSLVRNCEDRIRAMSLVHEKLYRSENLSKVNFSDYVNSIASRLFQVYGTDTSAVRLSLHIKSPPLNMETAIPLGLIINELVSNVLKHAFPQGRKGNITVALTQDKKTDKYTLTVTDDGIGIPEEIDYRNPETFGLQLINLFTEQLEGTMELVRSNGTSFEITFKEQVYKRRI